MGALSLDDITLRELGSGDESVLFQLYSAVRSEELAMNGWPPAQRDLMLRIQFDAQRRGYREQFPRLDERLIVRRGSPIGWVIVDGSDSRKLHGIDIAVLAEARQQGVGTRVMRSLQDEAAAGNRLFVILVERQNVRALAFHRRLGFRTVGDTEVHSIMEWRPDPQP
jgi:ribosomal protein S18 acetylase RimI-like enzyme